MKCVKILHTADCHIGSGRTMAKRMGISGTDEIKNTFFRILNICRAENVDFLLIAGDLFDTPFTDRKILEEITEAISRIPQTQIIIVSGNHDCAVSGSVYDSFPFPENVTLFTSDMTYRDFPEKNVRVYGAGFSGIHEPRPQLLGFSVKEADRICIGVIHGELTNSEGSCVYNPISDSQIASSGLDYLALGHIHKRSPVSRLGKTHFSYCGCPDGRGFDENGSCGVYIGTVSIGACNLEYRELSSRLYISEIIDISGFTSVYRIATFITEYIRKKYGLSAENNLYKIELVGSIRPDIVLNIRQIEDELESSSFFCEISDNTRADISDLDTLAREQSLRGEFVREIAKRLNSSSEYERENLQTALRLGLRAFDGEVKLLDN